MLYQNRPMSPTLPQSTSRCNGDWILLSGIHIEVVKARHRLHVQLPATKPSFKLLKHHPAAKTTIKIITPLIHHPTRRRPADRYFVGCLFFLLISFSMFQCSGADTRNLTPIFHQGFQPIKSADAVRPIHPACRSDRADPAVYIFPANG